jgi:uncharacterized RDD family membrane protein YckC
MSDLPPPPEHLPPPPPPSDLLPPPPGYQAYGAALQRPPYAGFGSRLGGWLIDGLIMALFFIPAVVALLAGPTEIKACSVDSSGNVTIGEELNALCEQPTGGTVAVAVLLGLAGLVGVVVYQAKTLGGPLGATIGMRTVGIRAVDANTGGPIGAGRAIGRFLFGGIISGWFFYLGYWWMLWDDRKQTWHDKVVSTVVVKG